LLQTYPDGGDCEASTGYHVLVAQMFLHSFVVQQRMGAAIAPEFEARLRRMFDWIVSLADDSCKLPHLGDCDNGRVELLPDDVAQSPLPAAERHSLHTGSLCTLASHLLRWPLGDQKPVSLMPDSGLAVLRSGEASIAFCAMPNGLNGKGSHTHCDKLSVLLRLGPHEVFCDSGSRCYTRSAGLRNLDRSTKAHNTLMVDNAEQNLLNSDPGLLFRSGNEALVSRIEILEGGRLGARASHRGYSRLGIEHQRTAQLMERSLLVLDEVSGTNEHLLDLHYLLGPEWRVSSEMMDGETVSCIIAGPRRLTLECEADHRLALSVMATEISREYGAALPATCIRIRATAWLPARVQTRVRWD
jgi:Heparinase II/III-like protein